MPLTDYIIDMLADGALATSDLVARATHDRRVTKEAVYKALRKLLADEIVVKRSKTFSLSNQWIVKMSARWRAIENRYVGKTSTQFLAKQGSAVYTARTLEQLDALWNHYILDIVSLLPVETPLLFYTPHYWFPAIRSTTEEEVTHTVTARGYRWMQLAGKQNKLDRDLEKYFPQKDIEYFAADVKEKNDATILGDYLIEVSLDKKTREYIDRWYEENTAFTPESVSELTKALKMRGTYKLKISRNKTKTEKFRKVFRKYFLIK